MKHFLLRAAPFLFLISLLVACNGKTPAGIPPTPTSGVAAVLPTAGLPAASTPNVTAQVITATTTITPVATAAITTTVAPAELNTLQALNIRSGPGLEYPVEGWLAAGARVAILGRSPDGAWWRIACPAGLQTTQCWIIGDATMTQAVNATAVPTSAIPAVPPTPVPTALPTPTPCVVSRPAGWGNYQVQSGDTLSSIASQTGTSVDSLRQANCLLADTIYDGASLMAPASGAVTSAGSSTGADGSSGGIPFGVAASLKAVGPGTTTCPRPAASSVSDTITVVVGTAATEPRDTWEIAEDVCIYVFGIDPQRSATVTVTLPDSTPTVRSATLRTGGPPSRPSAWWSYTPLPGDPSGLHTVSVSQDEKLGTGSFNVVRSSGRRINVLSSFYQRGEIAQIALTGFPANGQLLYLYQLDAQSTNWIFHRSLARVFADENGELIYELSTADLDSGFYLVTAGEDQPIPIRHAQTFQLD